MASGINRINQNVTGGGPKALELPLEPGQESPRALDLPPEPGRKAGMEEGTPGYIPLGGY